MNIFLHMGMPKTGTTTLQSFLRKNDTELIKNGVLYPRVRTHKTNHSFLVLPLREKGKFQPKGLTRYPIENNLRGSVFQRELDRVLQQIERYQPHTVILSAERLFPGLNRTKNFKRLAELIAELPGKITPVFYVRKPSDFYKSAVTQSIKGGHSYFQPKELRFKEVIDGVAKVTNSKPIVLKFERGDLINNSINYDFTARLLPNVTGLDYEEQTLNETLSIEASYILESYFQSISEKNVNTPSYLIKKIKEVESQLEIHSKTVLQQYLQEHIDHSCNDLLWLKDSYGIEFSGIDYHRIGSLSTPLLVKSLNDIFEINHDHVSKIMGLLLVDLLKENPKSHITNLGRRLITAKTRYWA